MRQQIFMIIVAAVASLWVSTSSAQAQRALGTQPTIVEAGQSAVWTPRSGVRIPVQLRCNGGGDDGFSACWLMAGDPLRPLLDLGGPHIDLSVHLVQAGSDLRGTCSYELPDDPRSTDLRPIHLRYDEALRAVVVVPVRLTFSIFSSGGRGSSSESLSHGCAGPNDCHRTLEPEPERRGATTHVVVRGETVGAIARRYGVRVRQIVQWNPGLNPSSVRAGTRLRIRPD